MILQQERVELSTPIGPMQTRIYRPVAPGKYPGLVLFSEIFQVTEPIARTAAMLAGHGFVVAAPDIYHELEPPGTELGYDDDGKERGNAHKVGRPVEAYDGDARAVIEHLLENPHCTGKLGCFGICIGGHLSFRCAMNPEILAAVTFYATDIHSGTLGKGGDDSLARVSDIQGEICMFWGRQDPHVPTEGRRVIYNALVDNNVNFTWHELNAQHAFLRDLGERYDPALATMGYAISLELFKRKLGEGDAR
jgi:carboxymethylenebutenolidase